MSKYVLHKALSFEILFFITDPRSLENVKNSDKFNTISN